MILTVERSFDGGVSWKPMSPAATLDAQDAGRRTDFDAPLISVRVSTAEGQPCVLHLSAHLSRRK